MGFINKEKVFSLRNHSTILMTAISDGNGKYVYFNENVPDFLQTDEFKELAKNANYTPSLEDGETVKQIILDTADLCKEAYEKYYAQ